MVRYFLNLSFKGTSFHGWQKQPNAITVQQKLEESISTIYRKAVEVIGAGRTDTGVHASQMIAHFDLEEEVKDSNYFLHQLNNLAGPDIAIYSMRKVHEEAHARFTAESRTYRYFLLKEKNPFKKEIAYVHFNQLDYQKMNEAASLILGKHDFSSFSKSKTQTKTNNCEVYSAEWKEEDDLWYFEISADRFLRNMVRAIVGTLIEVGEGKRDVNSITDLIEQKDRTKAGTSAPAHGLFLVNIAYPESIYIE